MKKLLLSAIIAIAFCGAANAQFGITGGGNLSKYKYQSAADRLAIFSWNAGLFYRIKSKASNLVVQPALLYTGKGAEKFTDIDPNEPIEKYKNHTNYLELSMPIIYSAPVTDNGDIRVDFGIGPYAAYLVSAKYTAVPYDGPETTADYKIGNKTTDDFKSSDAGLSFLMGLKLAGFSMNMQYDLGLSNVNPAGGGALKMRALMFNFAFCFGK
jgi:hypothetical protein